MKNLKLFVWTGWHPDWTDGLAFAIAEDEIEARLMIINKHGKCNPYEWGELSIHELKNKIAFAVAGGA
jgi:hypothetical protein